MNGSFFDAKVNKSDVLCRVVSIPFVLQVHQYQNKRYKTVKGEERLASIHGHEQSAPGSDPTYQQGDGVLQKCAQGHRRAKRKSE